jgi:glycogen debranching enzyme
MNKSISILYLLLIILFPVQNMFGQAVKVGFLSSERITTNPELKAAYQFLISDKHFSPSEISFEQVKKEKSILNSFDVIWIHHPDSTGLPESGKDKDVLNALNNYVKSGGGLFLTLDAFKYVYLLGLEDKEPEEIHVEAFDQGYGRKLGLHAFRSHPIFSGMNGGAYIWAPLKDQLNRQLGYYGDVIPRGKVVAVDWAYITLKEDAKLILEYNQGKGKVLAVGSYTYYEPENQNRLNLELFTKNSLSYLNGESLSEKARYWNYKPQEVKEFSTSNSKTDYPGSKPWDLHKESLTLPERLSMNNFWDVAGERMLIMGNEDSGIEEVWSHPFMSLRDYEVGVQFSYRDTVYWFKDQRPLVETKPESFSRLYKFQRAYIKEIITVDVKNPAGVIHYEYRGIYPARLVIKFKSNLRFMWPYSGTALRTLNYNWNNNLNTFIMQNGSGDFISLIGLNKKPVETLMGRFDDFKSIDKSFEGIKTDKFQVAGLIAVELSMNDNLDVVITGTDQGIKEAVDVYNTALRNPESIYENTASYNRNLLNNQLMITSPDKDFNEGYRWALVGTDRFFVNTPSIGKSLVAGYATTAKGWNGGHEVNGRPGYAWYFGRDGQWSGYALLDYGDFEKVKSILGVYQKYQDLSGKIYHELTTSGAVHYDASDATPLYIILAGKYLRSAGDTEFIRSSWTNIKKAVDYCFSTDTDGDHLIENTLVGHGWVEGGKLYGAKTTFYLAGTWAAALNEAAYMARSLGLNKEADFYSKEAVVVTSIVNNDFWNDDLSFLNYGKLPDGTYNTERTALPSVPMYFDVIKKERAYPVLKAYSTNGFSTNWGVRIISEESPLFNPRGYHYGSVWPLFTGWVSLAEYNFGRHVQGFTHVMNNLNVYKAFAKGYVEEVLNGEEYIPTGVCAHQCWSETMVVQPLIEGMLGLEPFAPDNKIHVAPVFPADWNSAKVENIRFGKNIFSFDMQRSNGKTVYDFSNNSSSGFTIDFNPHFLPGTKVLGVKVNGQDVQYKTESLIQSEKISFSLKLDNKAVVEVSTEGGTGVIPLVYDLHPEDRSEGFRIISSEFNGGTYSVEVEGKSKTEEVLKVFSYSKINNIEGGELISTDDNIYSIKVKFEESGNKFLTKRIKLKL